MPINIERPRSALLRGVKITEFKGHIINPDPIILQETDFLLEEFLSPTKLRALTGVDDLCSVEYLEMIVDTSETSLGNFGIYLPNLKQLKLNGSHVPRIRDLGTSLLHLKVLWLARSGLSDLDGIPTLNNLEEVYLAYNEITDISPCSMLDNIKFLDLEGNLLDDIKQLEFLNLCPKLTNLTLYGNPICSKPTPNANEDDPTYSYRHEIIKILPSLKILDDELTLNTKPIKDRLSNDPYQHECPFDDDWQLINNLIDEGIGPPEEKLAINESLRPGSSSSYGSRTSASVRPLSSMRPLSSYRIKTTVQNRPSSRLTSSTSGPGTSSSRIQSASLLNRPNSDPVGDVTNDASNLTVGPTLQGNPLRALMARRKTHRSVSIESDQNTNESNFQTPSSKPTNYKPNVKPKDKSDKNDNLKFHNKDLHDEVTNWKSEHAKKLEERKKFFEPQVLKIDDEFEQPISNDEDQDEYLDDYYNIKPSKTTNESEYEIVSNLDENDQKKAVGKSSSIRPKSGFKQSFDYELDLENTDSQSMSTRSGNPHHQQQQQQLQNATENEKRKLKKEKKNRSKSRDRSKSRRNRSSSITSSTNNDDEQCASSASFSVSRKYEKDESAFSSRVTTGDTGYASFSSSISSSITNVKNSDTTNNNNNNLNEKHQPIIVSSTGSIQNLSNSIKPVSQQNFNSRTTLRQLKTNLIPISGIKLPKS